MIYIQAIFVITLLLIARWAYAHEKDWYESIQSGPYGQDYQKRIEEAGKESQDNLKDSFGRLEKQRNEDRKEIDLYKLYKKEERD